MKPRYEFFKRRGKPTKEEREKAAHRAAGSDAWRILQDELEAGRQRAVSEITQKNRLQFYVDSMAHLARDPNLNAWQRDEIAEKLPALLAQLDTKKKQVEKMKIEVRNAEFRIQAQERIENPLNLSDVDPDDQPLK